MKRILIIIIICVMGLTLNAQNRVTLKNGDVINGKITQVTDDQITIIEDGGKVLNFNASQVMSYSDGVSIREMEQTKKNTDTKGIRTAGDELVCASNTYYAGIVTSFVGISTALIGQQAYRSVDGDSQDVINKKQDTQLTFAIVGYGIAGIGMIIQITAFSHVGKAGHKLNAIINTNGLGISMKF